MDTQNVNTGIKRTQSSDTKRKKLFLSKLCLRFSLKTTLQNMKMSGKQGFFAESNKFAVRHDKIAKMSMENSHF